MVRTSAPGNVFLFGEHAVVYEHPAIIAATSMRTHVRLSARSDDVVSVTSVGFGAFEATITDLCALQFSSAADYHCSLDLLRDLIKTFLTRFAPASGFTATVSSDIPRESGGMSSSTAVLCAMLAALNAHYDTGIAPEDHFEWVYPLQVNACVV